MKVEDIVKGLKDAGYNVEECVNVKNGVNFHGICFVRENGLCPVIYTDDIIRQSSSVPEVVEKVLEIYDSIKDVDVKIDRTKIAEPDFIMQNVYIGLQKESDGGLVKKETAFEGIEQYLYVRIDETSSYKLSPEVVEAMDQAELWKAAKAHICAETQIMSMAEMLSAVAGPGNTNGSPMAPMAYIVTNTTGHKGASAILDMKALKRFAQSLDVHKFIVLPSSVHKMIVIPDKGDDLSMFTEMVRDTNQNLVAPEERLTDRAYVLEV